IIQSFQFVTLTLEIIALRTLVKTNLLQTKPRKLAATTQVPLTSVTSWVRMANSLLLSARGISTSTCVCSVVAMATSQTSVLRRKPRPKLVQPWLHSWTQALPPSQKI
ncbi:hypothetical protein ID866_12720, partial [Astraeus odoratus]